MAVGGVFKCAGFDAAAHFRGMMAFIYVLHIDKSLALLNPVWGAVGVAFIAPAIVEILRAWIIKALLSKIGA